GNPPSVISARSPWKACPVQKDAGIAPNTVGSAHCLTAKRRTPFSPRAHYKLGTWFWGRRYSRWPQPHEFGIHHFYTWPTECYAFEPCYLVSHSPPDGSRICLCMGFLGR